MADFVKVRTHITNHERLLSAGSAARDLYFWGMLYAGQHETDGGLPMVAVLSTPWGRGGKANVIPAAKLVEVGLWERTDSGYRICRWAEQGNMTRAALEEKRRSERERKSKQRNSSFPICPTGTPTGTTDGTSTGTLGGTPASAGSSTSYSLSGSGSDQKIPEEIPSAREAPTGTRPKPAPDAPPDWWEGVLETLAMNTEPIAEPALAWLRYRGHRQTKGMAPTREDALYWLGGVVIPEQKAARQREAEHRKRMEPRGGVAPPNPADPAKYTPEELQRLAELVPMKRRNREVA